MCPPMFATRCQDTCRVDTVHHATWSQRTICISFSYQRKKDNFNNSPINAKIEKEIKAECERGGSNEHC